MSSDSAGITLVLDDENGDLKGAPDLLAETGRENIVYAVGVEEARSGLDGATPEIALINCSQGMAEAQSNLADLAVTPGWIIAAATPELASTPEFLRAAMQARFNDVITCPPNAEAFVQSIENGLNHIKGSSGDGGGKVVVLYSGKGGTGVSTIAVNLALALNRPGGLRIGLLDLDLQCGLVASLLNLQPSQTLGNLGDVSVEDMGALREEVHSRITPHESGLRVIASPTVLHDGLNISADLVSKTIRILKDRFDILIVDTPKWVGDRLVAALDEANKILLISEPQIPSLAKARESLRLFARFEYPPDKVELVLNRVEKSGELQSEEAAEALNQKVYVSLPADVQRLTDAANRGTPPLGDDPLKGPFTSATLELADKLRADLGFALAAPPKKKRGILFWRKS